MPLVLDVLQTAKSLEKSAQRMLQPFGLTAAQFNVLNLLASAPAGLPASALAAGLIVDPSNVTGLIRRMKADGLLVSVPNQADRRQHVVALSGKGRRAWTRAAAVYEKALQRAERTVPAGERRCVSSALGRLSHLANELYH